MKKSHASSPKLERKTAEKNRRKCMKNLCRELASLIPPQPQSRVRISLYARLEQAADYIKKMEERIRKLKRKRDLVMGIDGTNRDMIGGMMKGLRLPMVEVSESGSTLKVVLINGLDSNVMLSDVIAILEEEGAEVVSANKSSFADRCLHILHSQAKSSRVGYEIAMIHKRVKELVHWTFC